MILTPQQLWKDYDAYSMPFDISVLSDLPYKHGFFKKSFYFNGGAFGNGAVRVFANLFYNKQQPSGKAVLVMDEPLNGTEKFSPDTILEKGLACMIIDYAGESEVFERFTIYPKSLGRLNIGLSGEQVLKTATDDPKDCCRYVYAVIALRSIAFLKNEGYPDVYMLGIGDGGPQTFIAAYQDNAIKAGFILFSYTRITPPLDGVPGNDFLSYSACLDPASYAPLLKAPVYIHVSSNERGNGLDVLSEIFSSIKKAGSAFYISERTFRLLTLKAQKNLGLFLSQKLKEEPVHNQPPSLSYSVSENSLYITVKTEDPGEIETLTFYTARGSALSEFRNWLKQPLQRVSSNEYLSKIHVFSETDPIMAFVTAEYKSGLLLSSPVLTADPSILGAGIEPYNKKRIMYDSEMELGDFTSFAADTNPSGVSPVKYERSEAGSPDEINDKKSASGISCETGPFDISGVTSYTGRLVTFKLSDPHYLNGPEAAIQFIIYSKTEQTLKFIIFHSDSGTEFIAEKHISPMDEWSKFSLVSKNFRAKDGTTADFSLAALFEIRGEPGSFILSSMLFV